MHSIRLLLVSAVAQMVMQPHYNLPMLKQRFMALILIGGTNLISYGLFLGQASYVRGKRRDVNDNLFSYRPHLEQVPH